MTTDSNHTPIQKMSPFGVLTSGSVTCSICGKNVSAVRATLVAESAVCFDCAIAGAKKEEKKKKKKIKERYEGLEDDVLEEEHHDMKRRLLIDLEED